MTASMPGRRELAAALRKVVADSGVSAAEVGRRMGKHESTVSRYLDGKVTPKPAAVRDLVAAAEAAGTEAAEDAIRLAEDLHEGEASRVVILRSGSIAVQRRYADLEAAASHVASFTLAMVPGLLQSERYARKIFEAGGQTGPQLEENVRIRIQERQALLDDPDHQFVQITTEGVLRSWNVGPDVMIEQLEHFAGRARTDTGGRVRIGVIPWTTTVDLFPRTNFDLYDHQRAAVVGTDFGVAFLDRPRDVSRYVRQLQRLSDLAAWDEDAAAVADRVADSYRRLGGRS